MGIGLIPISQGMGYVEGLEETLNALAESVRGTYWQRPAPTYLCEAAHDVLLLPDNYTVLGAGVDLLRRLFYVSVESPEIPDYPEGSQAPYVRVVYESMTWSMEKNAYIPCPLRLCGITIDEPKTNDPVTPTLILDGRTPVSLSHAVKLLSSKMSLRDIFVTTVKEHPEFFEQLSDNNNQCADYLKDLIEDYFFTRWRAANSH